MFELLSPKASPVLEFLHHLRNVSRARVHALHAKPVFGETNASALPRPRSSHSRGPNAFHPIHAQITTQRAEPFATKYTPRVHALPGAKLHISPGSDRERCVDPEDGRVAASGPAATTAVPKGARIWKLDGKTVIRDSLILAGSIGLPANARSRAAAPLLFDGPTPTPQRAEDMKAPATRLVFVEPFRARRFRCGRANLELKSEELKAARELGFTSVLSAPLPVWCAGRAPLNTADRADTKSLVVAAR